MSRGEGADMLLSEMIAPASSTRGLPMGEALRLLLAAGLTEAQLSKITGFGLRNRDGCENVDTVLNKYAAGALSLVGVMGCVFGSDTPQHHRGHALEPGRVGALRVELCGASNVLHYMAGEDMPGFGVWERVCSVPVGDLLEWLRCPPSWFGDPVAALNLRREAGVPS
jgi:hypothetical protein